MEKNERKTEKDEIKNLKDGTSKKATNNKPRKTMRKSKKRLIIILIIITIVVTSIYFVINNKNKKEQLEENKNETQQVQKENQENIEILEDGTKLNISKKIKETKKVDGLEFSEIEITEKDNVTVILANVKNPTKETKKDYILDIKALDKNGNEITSLSGYIGEIKPNETISFTTSATFDFANVYDIVITKK